jgi:pyrophosphatase PpaX
MYRYLLFDLDGTILNTNEIIFRSFEHVLKVQMDYDLHRSELMKIFGEPLFKQMTYFSPGLADLLCEQYRNYYAEHSAQWTEHFPGVADALAHLHLHQIAMGVVTNKHRQPAELGLVEFGLQSYFDYLVCGDEVCNHKPHPESLFMGMELMKASPAQTLMIGDSPLDIEAAHRAGIKSALVGWTLFPKERFAQYPPDYYLNDLSDLYTILQLDVA